jgi:hypothetical protein
MHNTSTDCIHNAIQYFDEALHIYLRVWYVLTFKIVLRAQGVVIGRTFLVMPGTKSRAESGSVSSGYPNQEKLSPCTSDTCTQTPHHIPYNTQHNTGDKAAGRERLCVIGVAEPREVIPLHKRHLHTKTLSHTLQYTAQHRGQSRGRRAALCHQGSQTRRNYSLARETPAHRTP